MATSRTSRLNDKKRVDIFFPTDPVYCFQIGFIYGGTFAQFRDAAKTYFGEDILYSYSDKPNVIAQGMLYQNDTTNQTILWLPRSPSLGVVGHEIIHLIFRMLEAKGVPIASQNQETFAYHWEWWFDEIKRLMKLAKKKKPKISV